MEKVNSPSLTLEGGEINDIDPLLENNEDIDFDKVISDNILEALAKDNIISPLTDHPKPFTSTGNNT